MLEITAKSASGIRHKVDEWRHSELGEAELLNLTHFVLSLHSVPF